MKLNIACGLAVLLLATGAVLWTHDLANKIRAMSEDARAMETLAQEMIDKVHEARCVDFCGLNEGMESYDVSNTFPCRCKSGVAARFDTSEVGPRGGHSVQELVP